MKWSLHTLSWPRGVHAAVGFFFPCSKSDLFKALSHAALRPGSAGILKNFFLLPLSCRLVQFSAQQLVGMFAFPARNWWAPAAFCLP